MSSVPVSFASPVEYALQWLQYALPSSGTLYLDDLDGWFIEYRTVAQGRIRMELIPEGRDAPLFTYTAQVTGGKINRKDFASLAGKQIPEAGEYTLAVYEESRPGQRYLLPLHITETTPAADQISVTGEMDGDRMKIVIEDNGCGMTQEVQEKVRAALSPKASMRMEGTGIGIENVAARLRIFYGSRLSMEFQSREGEGTDFCLYLPIPENMSQLG